MLRALIYQQLFMNTYICKSLTMTVWLISPGSQVVKLPKMMSTSRLAWEGSILSEEIASSSAFCSDGSPLQCDGRLNCVYGNSTCVNRIEAHSNDYWQRKVLEQFEWVGIAIPVLHLNYYSIFTLEAPQNDNQSRLTSCITYMTGCHFKQSC